MNQHKTLFPDSAVRTILFDLDGTLRHNRPDSNHTLFDYAVSLGATDSLINRRNAIRWAHYYWAHSPEFQEDINQHKEMRTEFWENYITRKLEAFGCPTSQARSLAPSVQNYMSGYYEPEDWIPPEVPEVLGNLQVAGFTLGLITNRSAPIQEYLDMVDLSPYFGVVLTGGEVGSWKPDPRIFAVALEQLQISAHQAIYVGDNYYADIVGALRAGIHPVLYDPDEIFPTPDCVVIKNLTELLPILIQAEP
jgi:putative hydrolase of the HAD superfamily